MDLNERKRKILEAIIEDYISSAEPVGSRTISKHTDMGLSSATIRNEMSDLEEMGYLISPHTSAGRVPTDAGYRFYVNELMEQYKMAQKDIVTLRRFFTVGVLQLDRLIRQASSIVSQLTNYTTIAVTPELKRSYIKRFELVPVDSKTALLVLVTSEGIVKNQLITVSEDEVSLRNLSLVLNEKLTGLTLEEINLVRINEIQQILGADSAVLMPILNFIHQAISELDGSEVYVANTQNILNHPEYYDLSKAKELLSFLEDKESVKHAVNQADTGDAINVVIGSENEMDEMKDTSLVTAKYVSNGKVIGKLGIVGPTRMNYAKVIASLDYIHKNMDTIINELYHEEKGSD